MSLAMLAMTALLAAAPAVAPHSPTNDEINAAEMGNPESLDYRNRPDLEVDGNANAHWEALESGNPDAVHSDNRASVAATAAQRTDGGVAW